MVVCLFGLYRMLEDPETTDLYITMPFMVLLIILWLFRTMTITVDHNELRHWFGPSFWIKHYPISQISKFKPVTVSWFNGYGIRWIGKGWLYRVSGAEGVELELKNGAVVILGTNDASALCEALSTACSLDG